MKNITINKINKKAGFWIRFCYLLIDLILFCVYGLSTSLLCIKQNFLTTINQYVYQVKTDHQYYFWLFMLILMISIQFILIPLLFQGRTIGMLIIGLKIESKENIEKAIWKRIELGPILWIIIILTFLCFVNPQTINKLVTSSFLRKNLETLKLSYNDETINKLFIENNLTTLEWSLYSIPLTLSPMVVLFQLFMMISTGFRNNKISILDKFSNSQMVYKRKFIEKIINNQKIIEPEMNITYNIMWME